MKVVIIMDILVLRFYKYIKNIGKISVKQKLIKIYRNVWKNSKKIIKQVKIHIFKLFYKCNWHKYDQEEKHQ